jgi:type VI secretion system protein ImpG
MDDDFLNYYERELTFIREMGATFAKKYPKLAGRLLLEDDKCEDPHTERLIEAFAFISGRIHKKIDDDFPEITESLLGILYPHYINPIPSMSIVRFTPVMQSIAESGYHIPRQSKLYSKLIDGYPCEFKTCYPVSLWPIEVVSAELTEPKNQKLNARQAIHIQLKSQNKIDLSQINWQKIRFFLNGPSQHTFHLYELLFNNVIAVEAETTIKGDTKTFTLPADCLKPVGFDETEHLLPYSKRSFPGYLYLFEYFCFAEKFLFMDFDGLEALKFQPQGETLDLWFYLDRPAKSSLVVNKDTFCLNATPVVNLFKRVAEPIRVEHYKNEYRVIPDIRRQEVTEVYSVDSVSSPSGKSGTRVVTYNPFYSLRHHLDNDSGKNESAFWHIQRRSSGRSGDRGTEAFISFTDRHLRTGSPATEILTLHVNCTNRDLPSRLPFGDAQGDFDMELAAPVSLIHSVIKPTPTHRPELGGSLQWRFISHLSLNYLSIVENGDEGLKEILKLYNFENSVTTSQQIEGIVALSSTHVTRRIGQSFCRGIKTTITFDEEKYVGSGLYLFASVLERFLGQYVSVNSFSQLEAKSIQRKETIKLWAPRNGTQILL